MHKSFVWKVYILLNLCIFNPNQTIYILYIKSFIMSWTTNIVTNIFILISSCAHTFYHTFRNSERYFNVPMIPDKTFWMYLQYQKRLKKIPTEKINKAGWFFFRCIRCLVSVNFEIPNNILRTHAPFLLYLEIFMRTILQPALF